MENRTSVHTIFFLIFLCLVPGGLADGPKQLDFSFYHTTDVRPLINPPLIPSKQMESEISGLVGECNGRLTLITLLDQPRIQVAKISDPAQTGPKYDAFLLFGEHAREAISPETGFNLVKALCGKADTNANPRELLKKFNYHIVWNANPESRKKVEEGNYCLRTNENGVDLNRNWDSHWEQSVRSYTSTHNLHRVSRSRIPTRGRSPGPSQR